MWLLLLILLRLLPLPEKLCFFGGTTLLTLLLLVLVDTAGLEDCCAATDVSIGGRTENSHGFWWLSLLLLLFPLFLSGLSPMLSSLRSPRASIGLDGCCCCLSEAEEEGDWLSLYMCFAVVRFLRLLLIDDTNYLWILLHSLMIEVVTLAADEESTARYNNKNK